MHAAAACLLAAVREFKVPVTVREVIDAFKGFNLKAPLVIKEMQKLFERGLTKPRYTPPERFLPRVTSKLHLSDEQKASLIREASKLIFEARERGLTGGRTPLVIAATALYEAAQRLGIRISQQAIADAACVSAVSIRGTMQVFQRSLKEYTAKPMLNVQVTLNSYLGGVLAFEVASPGEAFGFEGSLSATSSQPCSPP